jgi:small Trp-rich protein
VALASLERFTGFSRWCNARRKFEVYMGFLFLALLLIMLKVLAIGPVTDWSWFAVLWPLVAAIAWWQWSDFSGWTRRQIQQRENQRAEARRLERSKALGLTREGRGKGRRR